MDRVWESGAISTPPTAPTSLSIGYPTDAAPSTVPGAWWHYMITEELRSVVVNAGMSPSGTATNQIAQAIALIAKQAVSSGTFAPVRAVDTSGVTMRYTQTIDGVALITGDRILRAVGTDVNNGIWVVNSAGAWARPIDYAAGSAIPEGMTVEVAEGTTNISTMWQLQPVAGEIITVGVTPVSYSNINGTLSSIFSKYLLITTASTTYAPLASPTFTGNLTLSSYIHNTVPFINASGVLDDSTNLSFDGVNFGVVGGINVAKSTVSGAALPNNGMHSPATNTLAFNTNGVLQVTLNSQGYFGIGDTPLYQGQITGAGQATAAYSDGGSVGAALYLQDTASVTGSGGSLLFGTTLGRGQSFAGLKSLLTDTTSGRLGNLAISLRKNNADNGLTEVGRFTSYGNMLIGLTTDPLISNTGSIVAQNYMFCAQSIATASGSNGQFLAVSGGGSAWYGAYLKNDGTNGKLGNTAAATTQAGVLAASSAAAQPFSWNLATGVVSIDSTGAGTNFGGIATGIAPAHGDSSNKLPTTSWVAAAITAGGGGAGAAKPRGYSQIGAGTYLTSGAAAVAVASFTMTAAGTVSVAGNVWGSANRALTLDTAVASFGSIYLNGSRVASSSFNTYNPAGVGLTYSFIASHPSLVVAVGDTLTFKVQIYCVGDNSAAYVTTTNVGDDISWFTYQYL